LNTLNVYCVQQHILFEWATVRGSAHSSKLATAASLHDLALKVCYVSLRFNSAGIATAYGLGGRCSISGTAKKCHNRPSVQWRWPYLTSQKGFTLRISRILTMVYNTQNYWVSGLCPSTGILNTRKHNVTETASVSVLRWREGHTYSVGSLIKS
jgi:hypothetical protein